MTVEHTRPDLQALEVSRPVGGGPILSRMTDWLCGADVVAADGAVASWVNPAHPGYAYPEAAALWLSHFALSGGVQPVSVAHVDRAARCSSVARWLLSQIRDDGSLGRAGCGYLFDTAVGLAAIVRYARVTGWTPAAEDAAQRLFGFLEEGIRTRVPVSPAPTLADRWSLRFAPHLLKLSLALSLYEEATGAKVDALIEQLVAGAFDGEPAQWARAPDTYVHALCYAVEGLLVLRDRGVEVNDDDITAVLDALSTLQRDDGGLPSFVAGGESRSDATAQALRAWTLWAPERYAAARQKALDHLASAQLPQGGLTYAPGRGDVNTWATLFAVQAIDWQRPGAARLDRLL